MEEFRYLHYARQSREPKLGYTLEEDKLFIKFRLYKCSIWRRGRGYPYTRYEENKIAEKRIRVKFSHFKQQISESDDSDFNIRYYNSIIRSELSKLHVPRYAHDAIGREIYDVVEAAVSPEDPVIVDVWEARYHAEDGHDEPPSRPNSIPASRSSIQGLEPVTVSTSSSCAVCLEDFEQELFTRLPCTHQFHVHCIVQCLEFNHLCPLCRYAMPTEEDDYGLLNLFLE